MDGITNKPHAVVMGLTVTGLSIARSLGHRGLRVIGVSPEGSPAAHSRFLTYVKDVKTEEFVVKSDDLVKTVKKLLHEGNVRRIIIKDEKGNILLDIPVTIGVVGAIIAPWLAALGVIGAIATNCTIVVERRK